MIFLPLRNSGNWRQACSPMGVLASLQFPGMFPGCQVCFQYPVELCAASADESAHPAVFQHALKAGEHVHRDKPDQCPRCRCMCEESSINRSPFRRTGLVNGTLTQRVKRGNTEHSRGCACTVHTRHRTGARGLIKHTEKGDL